MFAELLLRRVIIIFFLSDCLLGIVGCDVTRAPESAQTPLPIASRPARRLDRQPLLPTTDATDMPLTDTAVADAAPRIVAEQTHFHFGHMDPLTHGEHKFRVRNLGNAPLVFKDHRSTCKCTISETPTAPVPPGGQSSIRVRWQTEKNGVHFHESAVVITNDPVQPELRLTIEGSVMVHVTASPPALVLPNVRPDEAPLAVTTIASQVWDHFVLDEFESSLEGIQWQVSPAEPAELERLQARAGYRLRVNLPSSLPQGDFNHWIRFRIDPERPGQSAKQYELPLRGKVLRRLAVYGPGVDHTATVRLGVISAQSGRRHRLLMKVHDSQPELPLSDVVADPSFLRASLEPMPGEYGANGLYALEIEVPAHTLPVRRHGARAGQLRLEFDHPRIRELTLRVDFAVAGRPVAWSPPRTP